MGEMAAAAAATDNAAYRFPVSVKGVVLDRKDRVLLLRNERNEWELPGGKLELGEDPAVCVAREIEEEASWPVTVQTILDSWVYHITEGVDVLIVTYGCRLDTDRPPVLSHEHKELGLFTDAEVPTLNMPDGYKHSIADWYRRQRVASR
ncbi:NUDIX domain-containing protein [Actinoallomurus purpureus]|uniref:NUDIX hydrolase n=1 Tax=Actinoallomurus purpureus TaxID=478114 RepID=UPI002092C441|nr:NUDIX domain-containing protein [Actinoallomurus purpureus]MCO6007971.1 NUDIX domain-containing protein [Actinoallomurus purpureus]